VNLKTTHTTTIGFLLTDFFLEIPPGFAWLS